MKRILFLLALLIGLFSCKEQSPEVKEVVQVKKIEPVIPEPDNFDYDTLRGLYMGDFGGSPIRIVLNYVSSSNVIGYNIHKGLQRNLSGKVNRSNDTITMILNEPGDHEYDGMFNLTFIGNDNKPNGYWEHSEGKFKKKSFNLEKQIAPEKMDYDEINVHNFANFFGEVYDTLGSYDFNNDGLVRFEYYPSTDSENRVEQLKEINGSWNLVDSTLTIDWQPNKVFRSKQSIYTITRNDWGEFYLKGEDVELHPYFW